MACTFEALACHSSDTLVSLTNPTGRLNRGVRFALFVSFMQWVQQFLHLFPSWHRGLLASGIGRVWGLAAALLLPASLSRFAIWSIVPAGTGQMQLFLGGILTHHVIDTGLILLWMVWMLVSCLVVLQCPELSGFDIKRRFEADGDWHDMVVLFKYTFLVPMCLHFIRGCLTFGFSGAQNDLLVIVLVYPFLLAVVWTFVWGVVVAPKKPLLFAGALLTTLLTTTICGIAKTEGWYASTMVWLHLARQYLKVFGKHQAFERLLERRRQVAGRDVGPRPHPPERRWAKKVMIGLGILIFLFSGVLVFLTSLSGIQQKMNLHFNTIWFEREEAPAALRVDHVVSRLRLTLSQQRGAAEAQADAGAPSLGAETLPKGPWAAPPANRSLPAVDGGVSYALCGYEWYGLSALDYALLSLASYFESTDPSILGLLDGYFPKSAGIGWRLRKESGGTKAPERASKSRLSWIEVELDIPGQELPLLVISIRGTDPLRVGDYVEDIRMWTEPVALSILSTVFPTIRAWPRRTVEMVITGIHDFMAGLGFKDESWSYKELVTHVSSIPREQYSQIVLTGHSLGGGMATIVAALSKLPVISITPPGIYFSFAKHQRRDGTDDLSKWMHHQSVTLIVENDWVNGIFDDHGGLVQMLSCDRSSESLQLACHMIEGTVCHLFNHCGDSRKRWEACDHEYVLGNQLQSTAENFARQVLPDNLEYHIFDAPWEQLLPLPWVRDQPLQPGARIVANVFLLILIFFVVLPMIGGAIEELVVL